jgi:oxygen-independent coproporphyrinogen-3 oxidase
MKALQNNLCDITEEILTENNQINEYVMTGLRTIWGCDLLHMETVFGHDQMVRILKSAEKFIKQDLLQIQNGILKTTSKGKFLADGIAADLFII